MHSNTVSHCPTIRNHYMMSGVASHEFTSACLTFNYINGLLNGAKHIPRYCGPLQLIASSNSVDHVCRTRSQVNDDILLLQRYHQFINSLTSTAVDECDARTVYQKVSEVVFATDSVKCLYLISNRQTCD